MVTISEKTKPFDPADYIETEEDVLAILSDAFSSKDAAVIASAIGLIARSRGASALAKAADVHRASLYSGLSEKGNPTLGLLIPVLNELGLELTVKRKAA